MIPVDILFLALAAIAFLGFIIDSLFHRFRITSVLPLMLLGVVLILTGAVPAGTIGLLNTFIPYVSALTVAFILFHVGLEIRFGELFRVLGRATAYTLTVQVATAIGISALVLYTLHWNMLIALVFGFALSGPSSISVPILVRLARMPEAMRTTLLYESVISDVLQLLVPLSLIGFLVTGSVSAFTVTSTLLWTILGSAAGGVAAAVAWLAILDRLRRYASGYTWTLTITMVLATYGVAARLGLSPAIAIFVFGLTLGNAAYLDFRRSKETRLPASWLGIHLHDLRLQLGLSTRGLDIPHILQVQKEVSFFAASFFFVYIGLLFQTPDFSLQLVGIALLSSLFMLLCRFAFSPLVGPLMDADPPSRRVQRGLLTSNISRGLASAVVATVPLGVGLVIPGFLDAIFLCILLSNIVATVGVYALYHPSSGPGEIGPGTEETDEEILERLYRRLPSRTGGLAPSPELPADEPEPPGPPPLPDPTRRGR